MKRALTGLLAGCLVLSMVGCAADTATISDTEITTTTATPKIESDIQFLISSSTTESTSQTGDQTIGSIAQGVHEPPAPAAETKKPADGKASSTTTKEKAPAKVTTTTAAKKPAAPVKVTTTTKKKATTTQKKATTTQKKATTKNSVSLTTGQKEAQAKAIAQKIANTISGDTDIERVAKAAAIVSWICATCQYTTEDPDYPTAYGVFVKGVYTCAGSTRALGMVLECMGYSWKHVNENQWSHQWCELKMDGKTGWADGDASAGQAGYGKYPGTLTIFGDGETSFAYMLEELDPASQKFLKDQYGISVDLFNQWYN